MCDKYSQDLPEMTVDGCKRYIDEHNVACKEKMLSDTPPFIDNKSLQKKLAREYVDCLLPPVTCHGQEVRDYLDVIKKCRGNDIYLLGSNSIG